MVPFPADSDIRRKIQKLTVPDEIAQYRTELTDLLWEFDDYIELDDFDAEKFAQLQALSRKAAPKIYDIIMRMNLEPVAKHEAPVIRPVETPEPLATPMRQPSTADALEQDVLAQLRGMKATATGPVEGWDPLIVPEGKETEAAPVVVQEQMPQAEPEPEPEPPRPPSANPWDPAATPAVGTMSGQPVERRPVVSLTDSPTPSISRGSSVRSHYSLNDEHQARVGSPIGVDNRATLTHRARMASTSSCPQPPTIPEDEAIQTETRRSLISPQPPPNRASQTSSVHSQIFQPWSPESIQSSVFDTRLSDVPVSPGTTDPNSRLSGMSSNWGDNTAMVNPTAHYQHQRQGSPPQFDGHNPVHAPIPVPDNTSPEVVPVAPRGQFEDGLIPVNSQSSLAARRASNTAQDLGIGYNASFHLRKGFCDGATEAVQGGLGFKKTKKPSVSGAAYIVIRRFLTNSHFRDIRTCTQLPSAPTASSSLTFTKSKWT